MRCISVSSRVIIYDKMKRNPLGDEREKSIISYRFPLKRIIKHHENDAYNYRCERTNNESLIT